MSEVASALLGALVSFVCTLMMERWKQVRAARTAALLMIKELDFHRQRLALVSALDESNAEYGMKFPSTVWAEQGAALIDGASLRDAEPIINWYGTLEVLGYELKRLLGPDGMQMIGPDRAHLQTALLSARNAAQRLAGKGRVKLSASPFDLPNENLDLNLT